MSTPYKCPHCEDAVGHINNLERENAKLREELAQLRQDKARLDWLDAGKLSFKVARALNYEVMRHDISVRSAIDKAMEAKT